MFKKIILINLFFLYPAFALSKPAVVVAPTTEVKGAEIKLSDLASITTSNSSEQALVDALKGIKIMLAPPPRGETSVLGTRILNLIEEQGISLDSFIYSIPQSVKIRRAGREVAVDEVLTVTRDFLSNTKNLDLQVREVNWENQQIIPLGETKIEIQKLGEVSAGKMPLKVYVTVDQQPAARFLATALVDDWREIPVLNKSLERGMLIAPTDIELVRMNRRELAINIAEKGDEIIGKTVKSRISAGEPLRLNLVDLPPIIEAGKKISMLFRNKGLTATASGIAMEGGLFGDLIKVKNDSSKKIVKARILNPEQVEVKVNEN